MRVGLIQMSAGVAKEDNIAKAIHFVDEAASSGAKLIVLPEVFVGRGNLHDKNFRLAVMEPQGGSTFQTFAAKAREWKVWLVLGSILEKGPLSKVYNTQQVINPKGKLAAKYRKINLFDAKIGDKIIREGDCMAKGQKQQMLEIDGFKTGLSICYDLRFAKHYDVYRKQNADVLLAPSCFTKKTGKAHWEVLLRSRAIECLAYMLAPNQVGIDAKGVEAYGNSMIVDPWGEVQARGSDDKEEIVYGDIDHVMIEKARDILPGIAGKKHSR